MPQVILREDGTDVTGEQLPYAIPESPLHLCPACDYNLTGLRARRCPECGNLFELIEAKRHGARRLPHIQQDVRAVFMNNFSLAGGVSLFAVSLIAGKFLLRSSQGAWGSWLVFIGVIIAVIAFAWQTYYQRTLAEAALFAGLAALVSVGMIVIVFA